MAGFEITNEDVSTVLEAHNVINSDEFGAKHHEEETERVFGLLTAEDKQRIGSVEGDVEEMTQQALANLEEVLFEKGDIFDEGDDERMFSLKGDDNDDVDDPHVTIEIRDGQAPDVHLFNSKEAAATSAAGWAEDTGLDRDETYEKLMEDGEYTDGEVTVYVVPAKR